MVDGLKPRIPGIDGSGGVFTPSLQSLAEHARAGVVLKPELIQQALEKELADAGPFTEFNEQYKRLTEDIATATLNDEVPSAGAIDKFTQSRDQLRKHWNKIVEHNNTVLRIALENSNKSTEISQQLDKLCSVTSNLALDRINKINMSISAFDSIALLQQKAQKALEKLDSNKGTDSNISQAYFAATTAHQNLYARLLSMPIDSEEKQGANKIAEQLQTRIQNYESVNSAKMEGVTYSAQDNYELGHIMDAQMDVNACKPLPGEKDFDIKKFPTESRFYSTVQAIVANKGATSKPAPAPAEQVTLEGFLQKASETNPSLKAALDSQGAETQINSADALLTHTAGVVLGLLTKTYTTVLSHPETIRTILELQSKLQTSEYAVPPKVKDRVGELEKFINIAMEADSKQNVVLELIKYAQNRNPKKTTFNRWGG